MKRKVVLWIVAISITLLFLAGCSKDSTSPDNKEDVLMPLEIGNNWTMKFFYLDSTGTDTLQQEIFTLNIVKTIKISGQEYFQFADGSVARNIGDGLVLGYYSASTNQIIDDFYFKYPAQDGETYSYTSAEGSTMHLKVTKTSLTVPAGTFECYKYQLTDRPYDSAFFFAPGVGLIGTKNMDSPGEYLELISYNLVN